MGNLACRPCEASFRSGRPCARSTRRKAVPLPRTAANFVPVTLEDPLCAAGWSIHPRPSNGEPNGSIGRRWTSHEHPRRHGRPTGPLGARSPHPGELRRACCPSGRSDPSAEDPVPSPRPNRPVTARRDVVRSSVHRTAADRTARPLRWARLPSRGQTAGREGTRPYARAAAAVPAHAPLGVHGTASISSPRTRGDAYRRSAPSSPLVEARRTGSRHGCRPLSPVPGPGARPSATRALPVRAAPSARSPCASHTSSNDRGLE